MKLINLALIIPCYNEEQMLPKTIKVLEEKLIEFSNSKLISPEFYVVFIDDGSKDSTFDILKKASENKSWIKYIKLSKNSGHQKAILSGLLESLKLNIDITITIDADLQHDLNAIKDFIEQYKLGNEIVYGIRKNRSDETVLKKTLSNIFYKILKLMGVEIIPNHADYRLVSKNALNTLNEFQEVNLFLRGMFPLLGYKTSIIYYNQFDREFGKSKYSLKKMISLALDGITSFSTTPLRLISTLGLLTCIFSAIGISNAIYNWYLHKAVLGWSSIVISIYFIGGVQLISIGIIGEYIGKIYKEVKRRPRYLIQEKNF